MPHLKGQTIITVDFGTRTQRKIKPLHGINNSPVELYRVPEELKEAGIPFSRLHDTGGPFGDSTLVDIPNLFPDFSADENDPESYRFEFTDAYLKQLTGAGVEPFFRLGVTIENHHKLHAYRIAPPADPEKWARICEHVILHYNEGWANGFHFGIRYWEIWNEPENPPMWSGTRDEFFHLYRTAATHLKKCFPALSIGGYGSCGFYAVFDPTLSEFYRSFPVWFEAFLQFVRDNRLPLDFYS